MSVIVMGMEMPDTCEECQVSCEVGSDLYCQVTDDGNKWGWKKSENGFETRPDWCPLRPLPEKHGDLIDRDALPKYTGYALSADEVANAVEKASAIVESEG